MGVMGSNIRLLDCTLRDGGYVNDWNFGNSTITGIFDRLNEAHVDIIEIGFLDDRNPEDINRSIQPNTQAIAKTFSNTIKPTSMVVAMIDYGTCEIKNVQPCKDTILDGIRVIFKKENMYKAADFGKQLMDLGYKVFLQLVSITDYEEQDIRDFCEYVNKIGPHAISIVDTYGLMHKPQATNYFILLNKYLNKDIAIGYHSHNNFQLAYTNTVEILDLGIDRDIVLDGSLYGMGKSAGNAPLELIAMNLNQRFGKKYDIDQILTAIDVNIMPIYAKHYWGYNLLFYIAAMNDCHPTYVKYLLDRHTLSVKDVNTILQKIEPERKLRYKEEYIESLYERYILNGINDVEYVEALSQTLKDRKVLLVGPGNSIVAREKEIKDYISSENPLAIGVNFVPDNIPVGFVFLSRPSRYDQALPKLKDSDIKVIATTNITSVGKPFEYPVRYDALIENTEWDNALAILLTLLEKIGVKDVALAGFDGFKKNVDDNYISTDFDLSKRYDYLSELNRCMTKKIKACRKTMDIRFLTESLYEAN